MSRSGKTFKVLGRRALYWMLIVSASAIALALVEFGLVWFIQQFVRITLEKELIGLGPDFLRSYKPSFVELSTVLLAMGIVRALGQFLSVHGAAMIHESVNSRLKIAQALTIFLDRQKLFTPASEINSNVSDIFPKSAFFFQSVALAIPQIVLALFLLGMLFYVGAVETSFALIGLSFAGIAVHACNTKMSKAARTRPGEIANMMRSILRFSRNWLLVRILKTENLEFKTFTQSVLRYTSSCFRVGMLQGLASAIPGLAGILILVALIRFSDVYFRSSQESLLLFLYLFLRFAQTVSLSTVHVGNMLANSVQLRKATDLVGPMQSNLLDQAEKIVGEVGPLEGVSATLEGQTPPVLLNQSNAPGPAIHLKSVSFYYVPEVPILSDFSLEIKSGEHIGIVGASGSGKSTLLAIILGLLEPKSGRASVDNRPPLEFLLENSIGYVGPEPFLVEGTLRENLLYGSRFTVSDDEIMRCLESVALLQIVKDHPDGLSLRINENGEGLSAGQKQRVGFARALLAHPRLLILDEPTSNLDAESERAIVHLLNNFRGRITVLLVSHRMDALLKVDRVIQLGS